jgi:bud emergence protein 1
MHASVPRYCFADEIFWFIVEVEMEDGRHWELSRLYQDFYDLQINLIQEYPLEAGNVKGVERSLPYMPGPVTYVTDNISNGRRANLDEYIRNLLKLGLHITRGYLVRSFFAPREGDFEIDPTVGDTYRLSDSQDATPRNQLSPQSSMSNIPTPQSSNGFSPPPASYGQQRPQQGHMRNPSGAGSPPPQQYGRGPSQSISGGSGNTGGQATLVKIKVWFGPDSCVVIRMPPDFRYSELYKKLQERRALEPGLKDEAGRELEVCYRDEQEGRLILINNEQDLQGARERNERLVLNVRSLP